MCSHSGLCALFFIGIAIRDLQPDRIILLSTADDALVTAASAGSVFCSRCPLVLSYSRTFFCCTTQNGIERVDVAIVRSSPQNFNAIFGRERLLSVEVENLEPFTDRESTIASICSLSNEQMCRAVAGLFHVLFSPLSDDRRDQSESRLTAIEPYVPRDCVFLDEGVPKSVGLFHEMRHPSTHCLGPSKEGLSLFGLLDHCCSPLGKARLRTALLRPLNNRVLIEERQAAVAFFADVANYEWCVTVSNCLKLLRTDATKLLAKLQGLQMEAATPDWRAIAQLAAVGLELRNAACVVQDTNTAAKAVVLLNRMRQLPAPELETVVGLISSSVDFDESERAGRVTLLAGFDPTLDQLRTQYQNLPRLLDHIAHDLAPTVATTTGIRCVYFPQCGFLLAVQLDPSQPIEAQWHLPGLEYRFHSQLYLYFKNDAVVELDQQLHDAYHIMLDQETALLRSLAERVLAFSDALLQCSSVAADLDCVMSLSRASQNCGFVRPVIVDEPTIEIESGWNPLSEVSAEQPIVPNDTCLIDTRVQLVSGPNGSGKSCYLKQVALIVLLSHIGSFVPARAARIGVFDQVWAQTQYLHTASTGVGSFVTESRTLNRALRTASRRSLIVLDELSRGTNSLEGSAMTASLINHLVRKATDCPRVVIACHLRDVWDKRLLMESPLVKLSQMQVVCSDSVRENGRQGGISFLFRVGDGTSVKSYATAAATLAGIPFHIVLRAEAIAYGLYTKAPILSTLTGESSDSIEKIFQVLLREQQVDDNVLSELETLCDK